MLQPLSPSRLALGCELVYQRAGSEMQDAMISLGGYYKADTWEATARLGLHSWAIGYQQQFKEQLMLMADLEGSLVQVNNRFGQWLLMSIVHQYTCVYVHIRAYSITRRHLEEGRKKAWCTLFVHVLN